jgi:pyruvate dehydrogenase E2 component (dihydrolipoamide acetyltransferase)
MAEEIVMPRLSDSMEEGTILKWMKGVGDDVAVGDELVEIETDKANMVYEADASGTLVEIVADEGETLPIGQVIARVGEAGEAGGGDGGGPPSGSPRSAADSPPEDSAAPAPDETEEEPEEPEDEEPEAEESDAEAPAPAVAEEEAEEAQAPSSTQPSPAPSAAPDSGDGRVKASPLARRIARERGVELASLSGSGPGGRIIRADVERAQEAPAEAPAPAPAEAPAPAPARETPETAKGSVEVVELTRLQRTIARRMAESKATAPHFYLQAEVDMSRAFEARAALKAAAKEGDVVPSFNDMAIKACALALRDFPRANGAYRDGKWELYERVNVGVAVAAEAALVVPTIFDADRKGLAQIATEARALAAKVRDQTITPPELSGATFTVSNLGMYGVSNFHPVINSPQAAILAVGEIAERAVIRDGELAAARVMGVSLACDHRILYGADGAEFLARVRALLEEPLGLAL